MSNSNKTELVNLVGIWLLRIMGAGAGFYFVTHDKEQIAIMCGLAVFYSFFLD